MYDYLLLLYYCVSTPCFLYCMVVTIRPLSPAVCSALTACARCKARKQAHAHLHRHSIARHPSQATPFSKPALSDPSGALAYSTAQATRPSFYNRVKCVSPSHANPIFESYPRCSPLWLQSARPLTRGDSLPNAANVMVLDY